MSVFKHLMFGFGTGDNINRRTITFIDHILGKENVVVVLKHGGLTSIIKVYTDVRLEWVYFSGLQVYEWVSFPLLKYINGVSFSLRNYMNW